MAWHCRIEIRMSPVCCSTLCIYPVGLTVPSQICTLPRPGQTLAFELYVGNNLDGSLLLWPGEWHYFHDQSESFTVPYFWSLLQASISESAFIYKKQ